MNPNPEPVPDPGSDEVDKAIKTLSEHFDSVVIIATRYDSGGNGEEPGTETISSGHGNWSARYGSVKEVCIKMEEHLKQKVRDGKE